jgi:putative oxidoreductase
MMTSGYNKLIHFSTKKTEFLNFLGMGSPLSLSLCIFAEFFCALFIILGLFSRPAALVLIFNALVALFVAHNYDFFGDGQMMTMFFGAFLSILVMGPGKISVDGMIK